MAKAKYENIFKDLKEKIESEEYETLEEIDEDIADEEIGGEF